MAKLARKNQKIFTGNGAAGSLAVFGTMKSGTAQYSTDVETLQSTAYTQGWDEAILNDKAPYLEEMNGVQYGLSYQSAYILEQGIPEYSATQTYYKGSLCKVINNVNVKIYISISDNNTGNAVTDTFNWKPFNLDLYTSTGQNTDGTMTQKAISDGLDLRLLASTYNNNPAVSATYLKTTYKSGTSGYNIWSNGYCEQWGQIQTAGYGRTSTVSFTKTFANTNYQVLLSWTYETTQGDHGSTAAYRSSGKATNSFIIYSCFENYQPIVTWRVLGYLAEGQY